MKLHHVLVAAAAAAVSLVLAGSAPAAPAAGPTTFPTTAPAVAAEPTDGTHTPFVTVLYRNWDKWDANHDGKISVAEIDRLVADPALSGDDAAAAAAMKMCVRGRAGRELPPLTRAYFDQYNARALPIMARLTPDAAPKAADGSIADAAPATRPTTGPAGRPKLPPLAHWDIDYRVGRRALVSNGHGPAWQPAMVGLSTANLHQSATLGDCWLVASVGSMTVHRPESLRQLVRVEPDGSYTVSLHGTAPIHIPALTDSQRALGATSIDDGAWVAVLEQAIGRAKSAAHGGSTDIDGNDEIIGGDSMQAIGYLTGHKIHRITFAETAAERLPIRDRVLAQVRQNLMANIEDHRVITAGVDPPSFKPGSPQALALPHVPPNISKGHVYAIVGYDPNTDWVEIWNPHGQTFHPKGKPGTANGYETDHGRFRLPLAEAYSFYTSFTFEQDTPSTRPTGLTMAR